MDNFCGKRLDGRYEIREIIGVGGMAVVYKAYDNIDDRIVAIKILKDEYLTNDEFKRRFKNESKAIAVLSHPNIVRVYNVSFGDRLQYIVMEYVDGITLKEYIEQQGAINWKETVHFVGQILAALQHAHDKGIVHQDIKPQNIMLLQDGTIKVTDFGIARFSRTENTSTSENAIGSVHYISPEQARGEMTDDKADIYSIGVVMYEMLTGKLPFQADTAVSVAMMQLQQEPQRPREIMPSLPLGLEQITMRAMQKNPNDRYRSAAEMLMDINEFKRNPAVKFNYTYFVDREPTKFIETSGPSANGGHGNDDSALGTAVDTKKSINRTTAVMMGAFAGVAVLAVIIIAIMGALNQRKIVVPNFVSMNFKEVYENSDYDNFELSYEFDESLLKNSDLGTITAQSVDSGDKVKKSTKITLTVAGSKDAAMALLTDSSSAILSADVIGMTESEASNYLRQQYSLMVDVEKKYNEDYKTGTVFATDPAVGSYITAGGKITIYVATDEKEQVVLRDYVSFGTKEAVEKEVTKDGLKVQWTEVNSDKPEGTVISQSIESGETVEAGTTVIFEVSNGIPDKQTVNVVVTLPKIGNGTTTGTIKVFLDNNPTDSVYNEVLLNGKEYVCEVKGSGVMEYTIVYVEGDLVLQSGKIDFTKVPAVVTGSAEIIPNVLGMSKEDALSQLKSAGFTDIEVKEVYSNETAGHVVSQNPASDNATKLSTSTKITLEISKGPKPADAE